MQNKPVSGVRAPAPKPDWRGFMILALVLAMPVFVIFSALEYLIRWIF